MSNYTEIPVQESGSIIQRRTERPKKRLLHVDWVRGVAITVVVFVHICQEASVATINMPDWEKKRNDGAVDVYCTFGITIFFFCCGMAQTFKRNTWFEFIVRRFKRLILPFLVAIPVVLQPTQFISCQYGKKLRRAGCDHMYPSTDSPGYPEDGTFTLYNYPEFLNSWFQRFASSAILDIFNWMWFLPLMFATDILSFTGCRWMLFFFEGGWFTKENAPTAQTTERLQFCLKSALEKKDVLLATCFIVMYNIVSSILYPRLVLYWIGYWLSLIFVCIGLVCLRRTRRWQIWWIVKKILPMLTCFYALFWPLDKSEMFINLQQFVLFSQQGYLQQLVDEFQKVHCAEAASRSCMAFNLVLVVFMVGACAPTGVQSHSPFEVPMYKGNMGLAFLATIGNWITIETCDSLMRAYYSKRGNPWIFFHFAQFPMVLYIYHFLFLVIATTWVTMPLVDYNWSYPLVYFIAFVFTYGCSGLLYALLLQFKLTRTLFGIRHFDIRKDVDDVTCRTTVCTQTSASPMHTVSSFPENGMSDWELT